MRRQILTLWLCATVALGGLAQAAQTQQTQDVPPRIRGLLAALDDPDGGVVSQALRLLIKEKKFPEEQTPRLIHLLENPNEGVRRAAVQALGAMGETAQEQAPRLVQLLKDPDKNVREEAVQTLSTLGEANKEQAPRLAGLIQGPDKAARLAAAWVLSATGKAAQEQAPRLAGLLEDPDGSVFAAAALALGAMGKLPSEHAPRLVDMLKHPDKDVRAAAAQALRALGEGAKEQAPRLVDMLKHPDKDVRSAAAQALGAMGEAAQEQAPRLVDMLKSPNRNVTDGVAQALGAMGEAAKEQAPRLVGMFKDPDWFVRLSAAQALSAMGKTAQEQAPRLGVLLEDPDWVVRAAAAEALSALGEAAKEQAPQLTRLLEDPNDTVRDSAMKALSSMGKAAQEQAPRLVGLLKAPDEDVRFAAAQVLRTMGEAAKEQAPHLVPLLNNPEQGVRYAAAQILGVMGEAAKEQAPHLVPLLKDPEQNVREVAAKSLKSMGEFDRRYVSFVLEILENETEADDNVAMELLAAIAPLEFQQVATVLGKASTHTGLWGRSAWLLAAHRAGGGDPQVERILRWLPRRTSSELPAGLTIEEARETLRAFAELWPHTGKFPALRDDVAQQIARVANLVNGQWAAADDALLELHETNLRTSYRVHAESLQSARATLARWGKAKTFAWTWAGHFCFWLLLLFVYPRSPQVQAIFFWNPWVRTIMGFGYVGLLLTWVPLLRRRLLAPFANQLLADADLERFPKDSYFHGSQIFIPSAGRSEPLLTAIPQLRGQVVLEGASGLGKSLFIRYLLRHSKQLTVFLPAERCREGVLEAIQAKLEGHAKDTAFLQSIIYSGALDIYIDGLNEVTADTRARIVQFVERNFHGNILLATQRMEWTPPTTARLYVLQPLSDAQVSEFLASREVLLGEKARLRGPEYLQACERFVQRVLAPEQPEELRLAMREVLSNPMDLTVIAQMLAEGHSPDLFRLRQQQYELMARDYLEVNLAEFPLKEFAEECYKMRLEDRPSLPEERFGKELLRLESFKIVVRRQWKGPDGREHREWRFRHDKLQEFFIAQAFLGQGNPRIVQHMDDPRFRGVYFLLALLLEPESAHQLRDRLVVHAARTRDHSVSDEFVTLLEARRKSEQILLAPPPAPTAPAIAG